MSGGMELEVEMQAEKGAFEKLRKAVETPEQRARRQGRNRAKQRRRSVASPEYSAMHRHALRAEGELLKAREAYEQQRQELAKVYAELRELRAERGR
jgi:hypothetical protein